MDVDPSHKAEIIFIEPFYGGSHKVLIELLSSYFTNFQLVSLPAKKWHWRARCGALALFELIPAITTEKILFCSSVLNLSELLGLRPDLHRLKKIVYFHENQLIYPVQEIKARDIQYAYNQITTCLSADCVLFNSYFNRNVFLDNLKKIIKMLPDFRPKSIRQLIESKSRVIYFPMRFVDVPKQLLSEEILHIVWPHRWEFDKGPDDFFSVLFKLKENKLKFNVSVLGETFTDNPPVFIKAKEYLMSEILHFGYIESKHDYFKILAAAHVVVSTAKHEFFGVSMLEATYCGCYPLAPNSLVYPEIYPSECLYIDNDQLYQRLVQFCHRPSDATEARKKLSINFDLYDCNNISLEFKKIFDTYL